MSDKDDSNRGFDPDRRNVLITAGTALAAASALSSTALVQTAQAQTQPVTSATGQKPNIVLIISDDFGYGDMGAYGGGDNRGAATPNLDRMAAEGMQFLSFYGQPSCTPGRAAMVTDASPIAAA